MFDYEALRIYPEKRWADSLPQRASRSIETHCTGMRGIVGMALEAGIGDFAAGQRGSTWTPCRVKGWEYRKEKEAERDARPLDLRIAIVPSIYY